MLSVLHFDDVTLYIRLTSARRMCAVWVLKYSEMAEPMLARTGPKGAAANVDKLLIFLLSSCRLFLCVGFKHKNVTFAHRKLGGEQVIFWCQYYCRLAVMFSYS